MMTKLDLTNSIQSHLREIEVRVHQLQMTPLDDQEACETALEEITYLYGAVALCRSMLKQMQAQQQPTKIHQLPPANEAADRRPVSVRSRPFDGPIAS